MIPVKETKQNKLVRIEFGHEPVEKRIQHFRDFTIALDEKSVNQQSRRCLHCGTPYCSAMCPLHNRPVDFNLLVREGKWHSAWECLTTTNPFPEFTSRVCPALCEPGCTQYLMEDAAVGIKTIERAIIDRAWKAGWVKPLPPLAKTGKSVAVVGSGPAGMACAQRLVRAGHDVVLFDKAPKAGGLLRYGIPDFKLTKDLIDKRISQMQEEGVRFEMNTAVGVREFEKGIHSAVRKFVQAKTLLAQFDAVVLACGSETPRDLNVPGRDGKGVYFALDLLQEQNRQVAGEVKKTAVDCAGCDVVVIGGGDTGSDCVGTARRQGAGKIYQLDLMPMPPEKEDKEATWPEWPRILRTSTSHEEGCERMWQTSTKEILLDDKGNVRAVRCVKIEWAKDPATGRFTPKEVPDSAFEIPAQRVFLAMGFTQPSQGLLDAFALAKDARGNALAQPENGMNPFVTSDARVFACGDTRSGQSLVVRALREGLRCADAVDRYLSQPQQEAA